MKTVLLCILVFVACLQASPLARNDEKQLGEHLNKEQLRALYDAYLKFFEDFDIDKLKKEVDDVFRFKETGGTGFVTIDDFDEMTKELEQKFNQTASEEKKKESFDKMDVNGDGKLDYKEFISDIEKHEKEIRELKEKLQELQEQLDKLQQEIQKQFQQPKAS